MTRLVDRQLISIWFIQTGSSACVRNKGWLLLILTNQLPFVITRGGREKQNEIHFNYWALHRSQDEGVKAIKVIDKLNQLLVFFNFIVESISPLSWYIRRGIYRCIKTLLLDAHFKPPKIGTNERTLDVTVIAIENELGWLSTRHRIRYPLWRSKPLKIGCSGYDI